jgi:predicted nucleic acid-binding protein
MYLVDTDVISEGRKGAKANAGVRAFFAAAVKADTPLYISVITIGELRRGVEQMRHRNDERQAETLDKWLRSVVDDYAESILRFDEQIAQVWGKLRVPQADNALDKQIAATALIHDLTVVTRNERHFAPTGVRVLNPFS